MDVLDFIINVLREHEKTLDSLIERLEHLYHEPEIWVLEEKFDVLQTHMVTLSIMIDVLENRAFKNPLFTFENKTLPYSDGVLIDHINKRKLVFGRSVPDPSRWNVSLFQADEKRSNKQIQSHSFDSERKMLAWIFKYVLQELNNLTELLDSLMGEGSWNTPEFY